MVPIVQRGKLRISQRGYWIFPTTGRQSSVQFSRSVVSDSLQPHGLQHGRPPCPSSTPGLYSNSCPSSRRCHPAISSSVIPFSSCLQSFPASGSFQVSQFFASGGQSIGASAPASVLPMNIQNWFPLECTGWIFLILKSLKSLKSLRQHHSSRASILWHLALFIVQVSHQYMTTGKTITLTRKIFVGKVLPLLFKVLSRLVITFLPRCRKSLNFCLQSPPAVILEPPKLSLSLFLLFLHMFANKWWDQMPWS